MSIIKIKRSVGSDAPTALEAGELAITFGAGTANNAGERLFVGDGSNTQIIGGAYYVDMLDHAAGTLTASSALVVDENKKIDELYIDDLAITGNSTFTTLSTSNTGLNITANGDIVINGTKFSVDGGQDAGALQVDDIAVSNSATIANITISNNTITHAGGEDVELDIISQSDIIDVNGAVVTGAGTPVANTDLTTKKYVDDAVSAGLGNTDLTIKDGGDDTDKVGLDETLTFKGENQAANNESYVASNTSISVDIATEVGNNEVSFSLTDTGVTAGEYGGADSIPVITVDAKGRISSVSTAAAAHSFTITNGDTHANGDLVFADLFQTGETLTFKGGTGVTSTVSNNQIELAIGQDVSANASVTFHDVTVDGNLYSNDITAASVTIYGDLTVTGNTTTVNTEEINLADNKILLNSNQDDATAPTLDAGIEVNRGSANNVSFVWDETDDRWSAGDEKIAASEFIGTIDGGTF
jgi:hypothetical protein